MDTISSPDQGADNRTKLNQIERDADPDRYDTGASVLARAVATSSWQTEAELDPPLTAQMNDLMHGAGFEDDLTPTSTTKPLRRGQDGRQSRQTGITLQLDVGDLQTVAQAATVVSSKPTEVAASNSPEFFNAMGDFPPALLDLIRGSSPVTAGSSSASDAGVSLKIDATDPLTSSLSQSVQTRAGRAYREDQLVDWTHYDDPLDKANGRLAGNSRIWGDAPSATQNAAIEALINSSTQQGLDKHQTAMVLAIAHTESGFNPDAAAGTTSASGLGQFIDKTGTKYGLTDANRWDLNAQADALVEQFLDNQKIVQSRGEGDEYIYKYHHDGPKLDFGGLDISTRVVMPLAKTYETILKRGF